MSSDLNNSTKGDSVAHGVVLDRDELRVMITQTVDGVEIDISIVVTLSPLTFINLDGSGFEWFPFMELRSPGLTCPHPHPYKHTTMGETSLPNFPAFLLSQNSLEWLKVEKIPVHI